jgi:hypothetical protein
LVKMSYSTGGSEGIENLKQVCYNGCPPFSAAEVI